MIPPVLATNATSAAVQRWQDHPSLHAKVLGPKVLY